MKDIKDFVGQKRIFTLNISLSTRDEDGDYEHEEREIVVTDDLTQWLKDHLKLNFESDSKRITSATIELNEVDAIDNN